MADSQIKSPDRLELRGKPIASVRINKKAAMFAVGILAAVVLVIVTNINSEPSAAKKKAESAKADLTPALGAARAITNAPPGVPVTPSLPEELARTTPKPPEPVAGGPLMASPPTQVPPPVKQAGFTLPGNTPPVPPLNQPPVQTAAPTAASTAAGSDGRTALDAARNADSVAAGFGPSGSAPKAGIASGGGLPPAIGQLANQLLGANGGNGEPDLNQQAQKQAFRDQLTQGDDFTLANRVRRQQSPYELKTGTVIPAIMIGAINSDLPGEVIAQVSQNVYDSASGRYLLVPQGTRLFGRYDSNVTFGQDRLQLGWQRLIFPNGSTLDLQGMAGHDASGNAGFADEVNHHYGRIFGWALGSSLVSAAFQLSQPRQRTSLWSGNTQQTSQQVVGAAVGQELAQLGKDIARKNMQIQPTVTIRKGYPFVVMVNKDIRFGGEYASN